MTKIKKLKACLSGRQGFTLIELLIVIAVMAILTTVVFVALNPLARFQDSRNSRRWSDVNAILGAIKLDQVDNGGAYETEITTLVDDANYIIGTNDDGLNCANLTCDVTVTDCVDISGLVGEGYLPKMPYDPNDTEVSEEDGDVLISKYYLRKTSNGAMAVGACTSELGSAAAAAAIEVVR